MSDNYEINYEVMLDALRKRIDKIIDNEEEYFFLMTVIQEKTKCTTAATNSLMRLPISDQVKFLRPLAKLAVVSEKLCEKYKLLPEEEVNHD